MFRNILYSDIDQLAEFDVLIQSGFKINLKTAFTNLCKTSCHNNSIFQLPLWIGKVAEGELQKSEYLKLVKTAF